MREYGIKLRTKFEDIADRFVAGFAGRNLPSFVDRRSKLIRRL